MKIIAFILIKVRKFIFIPDLLVDLLKSQVHVEISKAIFAPIELLNATSTF